MPKQATPIAVRLAYDAEAGVWFIARSDLPGLSGEAATPEALAARIPGMAADLIEENGWEGVGEATIEITASWHASVLMPNAA